ncbi:MAG TPA: type VI secretion system tip protein TssI/VgrG [Gemmatimonadales bacterium]|nr:type VI secretion system tip protein TssI/VgrG [Gemmatimonadales bacterium]
MANYSQAGRPLRVDTKLGTDKLLLGAFAGEEAVSEPFHFVLELFSEDPAVDGAQLLRTPVSVTIELPAGGQRLIHGLISRFTQLNRLGELTVYRAEVVPWLWFLSLSKDCRIFQNLSVLEIIEKVFKDQGFSDFQIKCNKSYAKREFCVQYRETHLDFVSRLMEEEGIFYFFQHSSSKHMLTLADANSAVQPCQGQASARMAAAAGGWQAADVVLSLQLENAVHTGKVTLRDYDYLQPSLQLENSVAGQGPAEIYEYPGSYTQLDAGDRYARLRLEAHEALSQVVRGSSTCRAFVSGGRFDLQEHFRSALNQTYMLVRVQHTGSAGGYGLGAGGSLEYHNSFSAIPHSIPFRPARTTRKPTVWGSQTAVVVGKSGEEIWTDSHGRVKVHFHWDRNGKKNEDSSCWVRVATSWAGKNWGSIQIPRMGQEVIVDFLEGDPDRPIITGRVYNADQTPPYALPADQTQSGVKSRSSKGGGTDNFNEIRFEDKKGGEQIVIHAEKDQQIDVENTETVTIGKDRTESVGANESITIGKNRTESVGGDESVSIDGNRSHSVTKNESVSIDGNRSLTVTKDETISVSGKRNDAVAKNEEISVGENRSLTVGKDDKVDVGKNLLINAGDSVTLKTGDATITMKKNGDIQIKGKNIKLEGSGKIEVKASGDVSIKGAKVTNN